jgi:hypothetical protein
MRKLRLSKTLLFLVLVNIISIALVIAQGFRSITMVSNITLVDDPKGYINVFSDLNCLLPITTLEFGEVQKLMGQPSIGILTVYIMNTGAKDTIYVAQMVSGVPSSITSIAFTWNTAIWTTNKMSLAKGIVATIVITVTIDSTAGVGLIPWTTKFIGTDT